MRRGTNREAGNEKRDTVGPRFAARLLRVIRRIVGAPDYEAYLEHCEQAGHPPRLTEQEYVAQFFESKGKGVRCC